MLIMQLTASLFNAYMPHIQVSHRAIVEKYLFSISLNDLKMDAHHSEILKWEKIFRRQCRCRLCHLHDEEGNALFKMKGIKSCRSGERKTGLLGSQRSLSEYF